MGWDMSKVIEFGLSFESGEDNAEDLRLAREDLAEAGADVVEISESISTEDSISTEGHRKGSLIASEIVVAVSAGSLHAIIPIVVDRVRSAKHTAYLRTPGGRKIRLENFDDERLSKIIHEALSGVQRAPRA